MYKKLMARLGGKEELILPYLKGLDDVFVLPTERQALSLIEGIFFIDDRLFDRENIIEQEQDEVFKVSVSAEFIEKYRNLFFEYTGNASYKDSLSTVRAKLIWFMKQYKYDQETILAATELYLKTEASKDNYMYCRKAGNFIIKGAKSTADGFLENYCETVKRNDVPKTNITVR